jgi:hypothetical protein
MAFFLIVCALLLIAIPLLLGTMKQTEKIRSNQEPSYPSEDSSVFYTSSASERYGTTPDSETSSTSDSTCNDSSADSGSDSSSDSGSCDGGGDGGGSD